MSTSDIELAVTTARRLESLLETRFGASGRGLHEKLASVEANLPPDALRDGRYVATIRNRVVHEDSFSLPDRDRFLRCAQAFEKAVGGKAKSGFKVPWSFRVPWSVLIFLTGAVISMNAFALIRSPNPMGAVLLGVAGWMTIIPPIIWLARLVRTYKRGGVSLLILIALLPIFIATLVT